MALVNDNYLKLPGNYLFSEVAKRVENFKKNNPEAEIIRLGIGDVTKPLVPSVIKAMHAATDEMSEASSFRGYGPEQGYKFLTERIIENDFNPRGVTLDTDEIFVSDGSKSDAGNIGDIFGIDNIVAVMDPVYPVYIDTNVMAGRAGTLTESGHWTDLVYIPCTAENNFIPALPESHVDIIYLCFPNNPTGTTLTKAQLKEWVDYARKNHSVILFDAAYEAFITEDDVPHSIYEIEGAKECAIEFRSFSKTAGFTGNRCAYTVVPKELKGYATDGTEVSVNKLWNRRHCTKFNGVPYVIQKAAEAVYSEEGKSQIKEIIDYYLGNAKIIREGLEAKGFVVVGGINSPYIWLKTPEGYDSWSFFDFMLNSLHIVGTPGSGFGPSGEGYFRLTGFGTKENCQAAIERIKAAAF